MNKIKVLVNIAIVCMILVIAIYFPNIASSYLQKSLEGKLSFVDVGVKTYEVEYNNIQEKIISINKYKDEYGGELKTVPIATEITEEIKENLTKQVLQQFKKIQEGLVYQLPDLDKKNLVSCEKSAIYSPNEANGISFWNLKYQREKENIRIIMDTEFNCIYAIKLELKLKDKKKKESMMKKYIKKAIYSEMDKMWLMNIIKYFEFQLDNKNINIIPKTYEPYYKDKNGEIIFYTYKIYYGETKDNSSNISKVFNDKIYEVYEDNGIFIKMKYEFPRKEKKLIMEWGLEFFDSMIQL